MNKNLSQALKKAVSEYSPAVNEVQKDNRPDLDTGRREGFGFSEIRKFGRLATVDTTFSEHAPSLMIFEYKKGKR